MLNYSERLERMKQTPHVRAIQVTRCLWPTAGLVVLNAYPTHPMHGEAVVIQLPGPAWEPKAASWKHLRPTGNPEKKGGSRPSRLFSEPRQGKENPKG